MDCRSCAISYKKISTFKIPKIQGLPGTASWVLSGGKKKLLPVLACSAVSCCRLVLESLFRVKVFTRNMMNLGAIIRSTCDLGARLRGLFAAYPFGKICCRSAMPSLVYQQLLRVAASLRARVFPEAWDRIEPALRPLAHGVRRK